MYRTFLSALASRQVIESLQAHPEAVAAHGVVVSAPATCHSSNRASQELIENPIQVATTVPKLISDVQEGIQAQRSGCFVQQTLLQNR
jgi:hypothetical protein